jgi:uncharacterized protein YjbI with pentapeptide repeats
MNRTKEHKIKWTGKIKGKEFSDILFDELVVRKADIKNVLFKNVLFKNSYLGFDSKYTDCTFIDCKFYGKYSSLGKPAKYIDCRFENCEFVGMDLFTGQHFYNCLLTGLMKNPILNDKHPKIENNETVFKSCDLSDLTFDNVSIYGKDIFDNCILPKSGIRLFDNTDDKLIQRAMEICNKIDSDDKIESEIIFKSDQKLGQNPLILDNLFLGSFFKTEDSRKIFDEIINGYELNE